MPTFFLKDASGSSAQSLSALLCTGGTVSHKYWGSRSMLPWETRPRWPQKMASGVSIKFVELLRVRCAQSARLKLAYYCDCYASDLRRNLPVMLTVRRTEYSYSYGPTHCSCYYEDDFFCFFLARHSHVVPLYSTRLLATSSAATNLFWQFPPAGPYFKITF